VAARGAGRGPLLWTTGTTATRPSKGSLLRAYRGVLLDAD
jgi:hypothetical protein